MKFPLSGLLALFLMIITGCKSTTDAGHQEQVVLPEFVFSSATTSATDVEATLEQAAREDKLALIVMGAEWCHDSKALAGNFSRPELKQILDERFATRFVNVGYYNDLRAITSLVDYPTYFATPTVLVVDPKRRRLLNQNSMDIWQSAASVPFEEYLDYFASVTDKGDKKTHSNPELEAFIKVQVERLHKGYKVLGPMLEREVNGEGVDGDKLNALWREVRDFRVALQADIHRFHTGKVNQNKSFPSYEKQSWE